MRLGFWIKAIWLGLKIGSGNTHSLSRVAALIIVSPESAGRRLGSQTHKVLRTVPSTLSPFKDCGQLELVFPEVESFFILANEIFKNPKLQTSPLPDGLELHLNDLAHVSLSPRFCPPSCQTQKGDR